MKERRYEFVELESTESFDHLREAFGGCLNVTSLLFDNPIVKGELVKKAPEDGLWIRKWKLTVFEKITLSRQPAADHQERKFSLIYFLKPSLFQIKKQQKKLVLNSHRNNLFVSNKVLMDFSVMPRQPFLVMDITFTTKWLLQQFTDADPLFKNFLNQHLNTEAESVVTEPCGAEDYKLLHELDTLIQADEQDLLSIRSRIYELICSFFGKVSNKPLKNQKHSVVQYEQIIQAEAILMQDLQKSVKVETIARNVNISASSLLRHFKLIYGKSMQQYYLEKKMEFARKMLLENRVTVKKVAQAFGYKQPSAFIEIFTKQFGYSPGTLKVDRVT